LIRQRKIQGILEHFLPVLNANLFLRYKKRFFQHPLILPLTSCHLYYIRLAGIYHKTLKYSKISSGLFTASYIPYHIDYLLSLKSMKKPFYEYVLAVDSGPVVFEKGKGGN
jgi:hypothetical protein